MSENKNNSELQLWRDVFIVTKRHAEAIVAINEIHKNDPVRQKSVTTDLLANMNAELRPYADQLREAFDVGPNEWQQRIVASVFGIDGRTVDRAWWASTMTNWWREWDRDAARARYESGN